MIKTNFKGKENALIVKNNRLIEAKMNFSANEYKFITFATSQIDREASKFDVLEMRVKDLKEYCFKHSKTTKGTYSHIKKYAYAMARKNITIRKNEKDIVIYNWFDKVETERGAIEVCFSSKMDIFLLNNKKNFTSYKISNILKLDTFYQIRLYEILKQYEKVGFRDIELEDLKFMLGIEEGKIKRFADFKERVLNRAIKIVNERTDIKVTYDFTKIGANVKFKFGILGKNTLHKSKELLSIKEKIESVVNREVHLPMLQGAIRKYEIKKKEIELYLNNWNRFDYKTKDDPAAFFIWVVANRKPIPEKEQGVYKNKPIQSTNYEQRKYDEEFIESLYDNF